MLRDRAAAGAASWMLVGNPFGQLTPLRGGGVCETHGSAGRERGVCSSQCLKGRKKTSNSRGRRVMLKSDRLKFVLRQKKEEDLQFGAGIRREIED